MKKASLLICNLWHIKQTNGLFYYALDYIRTSGVSAVVYVRAAILSETQTALPNHDVRCADTLTIIWTLLQTMWRRQFIFTPTSHPLPFYNRQIFVIHDDYPFLSKNGWMKRLLFRIALKSSTCEIGHINHTTALDALSQMSIHPGRLRFMPNRAPDPAVVSRLRSERNAMAAGRQDRSQPLRIALLGTDSSKKRYAELFKVCKSPQHDHFQFEIYGHANLYYKSLEDQFPDLNLKLISSSKIDAAEFLKSIDVVVSVAEHEGFGRLIALAISAGISCYLLESPVFREFFSRSTRLHTDIGGLVDQLSQHDPTTGSSGRFEEQEFITHSYQAASDHLLVRATAGVRAA